MRQVLRPTRRRPARPCHPDRSERRLFPCAHRMAATALVDRGIRARPFADSSVAARNRPVRGDRHVNDTLMLAIGLLADDAPRNTGPDFGKASPFGLVIVVLLLIGTFLLVWSMNRHLRKLPKSFDESEPDRAADEDHKSEPGG